MRPCPAGLACGAYILLSGSAGAHTVQQVVEPDAIAVVVRFAWSGGTAVRAAGFRLFGPGDARHNWRQPLEPGASFRTVPAALALSADGGPDDAFAALTRYRRAARRPHPDHRRLPVIFNDYMNCLMGDPTAEKLLPLVDAAAEAGAEYFVIDAGWYDDDYLGIDQGPIVAMIENHRSDLVWSVTRRNPHVKRGLLRAGFTGGWLDSGSTVAKADSD